jgi:predicted AAA+ superfamily ATPase
VIPRLLQAELRTQLTEFPIVTVLGPRQAGKTTLARATAADFEYVSLEDPETLTIATEDPRGFLQRRRERVIFDEIQRAPHLLSYLQGIVDEGGGNGRFVLTGSHQLELREAIGQSLAGRTGMLHLLPLSIPELEGGGIRFDAFEDYLLRGFLPRVHAENQRPRVAYARYYQTYVERDVGRLIRLKDATLFETFMKLLAGRVGQIVNYASLAGDVGVDAKTLRSWLSILEASFVVFRLPPYHRNFGKRLVKSPKVYFTDTGLLCYLLGIEEPQQIRRDPLVGHLFENLVVLEALKARYNQARQPALSFFRDNHGHEIDLLLDSGRALHGVEIKSAATYHASFKKNLRWFDEGVASLARAAIVYNGDEQSFSDGIEALPLRRAHELFEGV